MSDNPKLPIAKARFIAETLIAELADTYGQLEIAGSIRRQKPMVGDIDLVIMPKFAERLAGGFFPETVNLVWFKLDQMLLASEAVKHLNSIGRTTWGEKLRYLDYRGLCFNIQTADAQNWGNWVTIRTGPAEFSEMMVTRLHGTRLRQRDGYLKYDDGTIFPCATEEKYFEACRMRWVAPEHRDAFTS